MAPANAAPAGQSQGASTELEPLTSVAPVVRGWRLVFEAGLVAAAQWQRRAETEAEDATPAADYAQGCPAKSSGSSGCLPSKADNDDWVKDTPT